MKTNKVIIIGSGVAGLAAAIRMAVKGFEVSVYEKNNYPGGKLSALKKDGYIFDAGPSLFTQPYLIEELFELANEPIENYFSYQKLPIACKYFYEDGKTIEAFTDPAQLDAELHEKINEPVGNTEKYLAQANANYKRLGSIFLNYSLHQSSTWMSKNVVKALSSLQMGLLTKTLNEHNQIHFSSEAAVQIFNRYATYNGSNPYQAPAMLSLIPQVEYHDGVFFPTGGMISITNALFNLATKLGVKFYFDKPVQKIIHSNGKAGGIVVGQENIFANIVISNTDIYFTFKNLLNELPHAQKILKRQSSSSALVFYWGIKKEFAPLQLHNIFFSKNYKEEFDNIFLRKKLGNDPTIYINITSKMEDGLAPKGCENWFVMVNAPENIGQDWEQIKIYARAIIIEKLNRVLQTDIAQFIETEEILDPIAIEEKTGSFKGALYGMSSNSKWAAFLRQPNFSKGIKNLYFCGGTVHPGGGIPLCLQSAKIVSELIKMPKSGH